MADLEDDYEDQYDDEYDEYDEDDDNEYDEEDDEMPSSEEIKAMLPKPKPVLLKDGKAYNPITNILRIPEEMLDQVLQNKERGLCAYVIFLRLAEDGEGPVGDVDYYRFVTEKELADLHAKAEAGNAIILGEYFISGKNIVFDTKK